LTSTSLATPTREGQQPHEGKHTIEMFPEMPPYFSLMQ
jgi:hypothetical protein